MSYTNQVRTERVVIPSVYQTIPGSSDTTWSINTNVSSTRSGTKVDNWKEKIRKGENATSDYSLTGVRVILGKPYELTARFKQFPPDGAGDQAIRIYGYPSIEKIEVVNDHLSVNTSEAEAMALSKTYKKVQSEWQHMNSPAIIAEFLDVIRQFGKPAEALVDLTNRRLNRLALERRGLKGSTSFKKVKYAEIVASTWLEYSFGLAPLISDSMAAAETLARWQLEKELPQLRKKMQSRGLSQNATVFTGATGVSPIAGIPTTMRGSIKKVTKHRVQYTLGLAGEITADYGSNDRLIQLLGFDHANWVPAIWEAVPWSWLVDYFTNVQQILDASVTNTGRIKWISKAVSTVTEKTYTTSILKSGIASSYAAVKYKQVEPFAEKGDGAVKVIRTTFTRTSPTSLGVPPLVIEHPFNQAKKVANMVAVLFKKKGNSALWIT